MLSFLLKIILLEKAFSFSAISISDDIYCYQLGYVFIQIFREKRFNYFPKRFIFVNVFNAEIAIMIFFSTSDEFYATITFLIVCCFFSFSSDLQRRSLFLNLDLVIIFLLMFLSWFAWFALVCFFFRRAWQFSDFYMHQRNHSSLPLKCHWYISHWLNQCKINHLKKNCNFDSWLLLVICFWKTFLGQSQSI